MNCRENPSNGFIKNITSLDSVLAMCLICRVRLCKSRSKCSKALWLGVWSGAPQLFEGTKLS